jgi:hypothetical protein
MPYARALPINAREVLERVMPRRPFPPAARVSMTARPDAPSTARTRPSRAVRDLLLRLPAGLLDRTAERYPHVLEIVAREWGHGTRLNDALDGLVFDTRGSRVGFPVEVLNELTELRRCHDAWVTPRPHRSR